MTGTNKFSTKRLFMRRYRMDDARVLFEKFGCDPQMYEYSGWNPYATYEMAKETIQKFINSYDNSDFYGWAIEFQGNLIGTIGAYDYDSEKNQIEIGISIERSLWGNGFAAESLTGLLQYLTEHEGIEVITAWCASENTGSMKAMQKAGMTQIAIEKGALEVEGKNLIN